MVKRKVSLASPGAATRADADGSQGAAENTEILDLFFDPGIVFHEVALPAQLPDVVSSFVVMKDPRGGDRVGVRRAAAGEEPDVEVSALEHLNELGNRWLPVPYQL